MPPPRKLGFGLTPVPAPIPAGQQAVLLTGEVSAYGLPPTVGPTPFRLRATGAHAGAVRVSRAVEYFHPPTI